ncbi:MAG: HAD-IA family hydrolase [Betaproteobacteria bacterium]|jgi:phosphoglycolate phosphatase|nr:HAD-IA family hydrolase [Betaproteobacteria bacterium]
MTERYRLVVFDWDGTLADSAAIIAESIQEACRDLGLEVPDESSAKYVIGLGLADAVAHVAPGIAPAARRELAERYRSHYLARDPNIRLFAGVTELLDLLAARGAWLAVATGKSRVGLARALEQSGLGGRFLATRCADEGLPKPHPDMLLHLIEHLGVAAAETVMIGDTTHDVQMAHNAGVAGVAVSWGAHPVAALRELEPQACLHSVHELRQWLEARL